MVDDSERLQIFCSLFSRMRGVKADFLAVVVVGCIARNWALRFGAVRLSQCSKRLRDITQPVLFHVFHSPVRHSSKATHRSLAAFVRILFSRPDRALSVRSLVLSAYDDEDLLRSCSSLFDPELRLVPDNVTFVRAVDGLASWWEEVLTRRC